MRTSIISFLFLALGLTACQPDISIDEQLSPEAQSQLQYDISRYVAHLPAAATHETKFEAQFNDYYKVESDKIYPKFFYNDRKSKRNYFLITRIAPSIHQKYVALGGYFIRGESEFDEYVEVFRTWKFTEDELMPKAEMLFKKMIKGADLSRFYPEVTSDQYIQFPNEDTYFDKAARVWVSTRENKLQEMKDEAARALKEAGDAVRDARSTVEADSTAN